MYQNRIKAYQQSILENQYKNTFRTLTVTYIHGATGRGKTRYVMDKYGYENIYRITNYTHPFDMYTNQKIIVFEEFYSSTTKIQQMLNYLDGYPLTLPARYGDKIACYTKVYIISNWQLIDQYKNIQSDQPATWAAFKRRIHKIVDFTIAVRINSKTTTPQQVQMQLVKNSDDELPFWWNKQ